MNSSIAIRGARPGDSAAVSALGRHVFAITFGHSVTPKQLETYLDGAYTPTLIEQDISDTNKHMLVAEDESNKIVGFCQLSRASSEPCVETYDRRVELLRLYVDAACHGKGVGKTLAAAIEDIARLEGWKYMWLGVWEENHKAQAVYNKLGYKRVGEHVFDVGGDLQTDLIMIKEL